MKDIKWSFSSITILKEIGVVWFKGLLSGKENLGCIHELVKSSGWFDFLVKFIHTNRRPVDQLRFSLLMLLGYMNIILTKIFLDWFKQWAAEINF